MKALLLQNKSLAAWWASVTKDPNWEQVIALAQSEMFQRELTHETMQGAKLAFQMLETFADNPLPDSSAMPTPGYDHRTTEQIFEDHRKAQIKPKTP